MPKYYFRPHRMQCIDATTIQTSHVVWCVYLCVCVLDTQMSWAKTIEPIEMPFGG